MTTLPAAAVPVPAARGSAWHVSPLADVAFYHWSWLAFFAPMVLIGGDPKGPDLLAIWILGNTLSFAHRHITMPYVYLDGQVFRQHVARFAVAPILLVACFLATPAFDTAVLPPGFLTVADLVVVALAAAVGGLAWWEDRRGHTWSGRAQAVGCGAVLLALAIGRAGALHLDHRGWTAAAALGLGALGASLGFEAASSLSDRSPARRWGPVAACVALAVAGAVLAPMGLSIFSSQSVKLETVYAGLAAATLLWNVWHVYMQKYGILRMYSAKSAVPVDRRPPAIVDRLLVFGWVPLYFAWFSEHYRAMIRKYAEEVFFYLRPIINAMHAAYPVILPIGIGCVAATVLAWAWFEWRAGRFASAPRTSMAVAFTALGAAILYDPVKGYIAFGFAHAVEYIAFVWAFQRKKYATRLPHDPLLGRLLRRPWAAYGAFFALVGIPYAVLAFGKQLGFLDPKFAIFGTTPGAWLYYWTVWQSIAHFWFDGFLWKMRLPQVRAGVGA